MSRRADASSNAAPADTTVSNAQDTQQGGRLGNVQEQACTSQHSNGAASRRTTELADNSRPKASQQAQSSSLAAVTAVTAWGLASGARMFANKAVYGTGFRYPLAVTGACQITAFLGAIVLHLFGAFPWRPCKSWRVLAAAAMPAALATVATLYAGNVAVMTLPVTLVQILKVRFCDRFWPACAACVHERCACHGLVFNQTWSTI